MRPGHQDLKGRSIVAADGFVVGEVDGLLIDVPTLRVVSIEVKLAKAVADRLGADRTWFRAGVIDLPVELIQSVGDAIVLGVPMDALRDAQVGGAAEAASSTLVAHSGPVWFQS